MEPFDAWMDEAIDLAAKGIGSVEPNPPVGALLVRDGAVLGRGYHRAFGRAHAEVEAMADARAAGVNPAGATAVVTLEPCCHTGKTGPCTDALIDAGITRVVAAIEDPDANVAGQGFAKLRAAGVEVIVGPGERRARELLGPYIKLRTQARPWVIAKWAQTLDGRIAAHTGHSRWVSGEASRQRVHDLRAICDGVAAGIGTMLTDDPLLTNRSGRGRQPKPLVLDDRLDTPTSARLFEAGQPVLIATCQATLQAHADRAAALTAAGAEVLSLPGEPGGVSIPALLDELGRRNWTRLLVEGGPTVMGSLLSAGLADELWVFVAPKLLGHDGLPAVRLEPIDQMDQAVNLPAPRVEAVGEDLLLTYRLGS